MTMLKQVLSGELNYKDDRAIYAERIDIKFPVDSSIRFGSKLFEEDTVLDNKHYFSSIRQAASDRDVYCNEEKDSLDLLNRCIETYIDSINEEERRLGI